MEWNNPQTYSLFKLNMSNGDNGEELPFLIIIISLLTLNNVFLKTI